jgi:3-methyladenine DNA glycosylase AlkD
MPARKHNDPQRAFKFFLVASSHDSLLNMLSINFAMMQNFHYTLSDLEGMMPWERRVYIDLLLQHLKDEKERLDAMKADQ